MVAQHCESTSCHQTVHLAIVKMADMRYNTFYHKPKTEDVALEQEPGKKSEKLQPKCH